MSDKVHIYIPIQNNVGDVIQNITVRLLQPDTTSLIADDVYASPTDPDSIIGQPFAVTNGIIDVYIQDAQRMRIGVTLAGQTEFFLEDVDVYPSGDNVAVTTAPLAVTNTPTRAGMVLSSIDSNTAEWAALGVPTLTDSNNVVWYLTVSTSGALSTSTTPPS